MNKYVTELERIGNGGVCALWRVRTGDRTVVTGVREAEVDRGVNCCPVGSTGWCASSLKLTKTWTQPPECAIWPQDSPGSGQPQRPEMRNGSISRLDLLKIPP